MLTLDGRSGKQKYIISGTGQGQEAGQQQRNSVRLKKALELAWSLRVICHLRPVLQPIPRIPLFFSSSSPSPQLPPSPLPIPRRFPPETSTVNDTQAILRSPSSSQNGTRNAHPDILSSDHRRCCEYSSPDDCWITGIKGSGLRVTVLL